jgi:hypothetical protein
LFKQVLQHCGLLLLHFHGCGDAHEASLQVMGEPVSIPMQSNGPSHIWIKRFTRPISTFWLPKVHL